ncbi:MAG: serine hydrolase domain-containing protein [Saprospiraceae bacterium]
MRLVLFLMIMLLINVHGRSQHDEIRKEIDKLIRYETNIDFANTPGFIVGMIDGDSTYIFPYGSRSLEENKPILEDDIFEIGGVTKLFTALLVESLISEHQLNLNHSINEYLPVKNPAFDSCTVLRLLTHTAGLPKYPPRWGSLEQDSKDPYAAFSQSDLETFYKEYHVTPGIKNEYLYSHLNYVLLSWVMQEVTQLTYTELLIKYLPTDVAVTLLNKPTIIGYGLNIKPIPPWTTGVYGGSLGIKGSLRDLLNTCRHFFSTSSVYSSMLETYPAKIRKEKSPIGIGWQVIPIPKNRFVFVHTGKTKGHHTFVGILPDNKTGVVVLSNSAAGSDALGINILGMMNNNWKRK